MSQCGGQVPRHKGDSAVVKQSGLGGFPQEELLKGSPDLRQMSSTGVSDAGASLARVKRKKKE
ncbi:hypothetical protein ACX27_06280 [Nostoc piscinale CENA21]|uniref:Uncharacterized protein n=1 Tax=Nostoc piscinale CENA21 TaxID=224013 RepID=A0A0M3V4U2_9NOSO|nr:hypothetical protein ACX27_06280 [Nostoc piscinale CENA21]